MRNYLKESAHPFYGAVIGLGMLLFYEVFLLLGSDLFGPTYRNLPEAWARDLLYLLGADYQGITFFWLTLALLAVPYFYYKKGNFQGSVFVWIGAESVLWGLASGMIIQTVLARLFFAQGMHGSFLGQMGLAIGAGLFEELFFRVGLTSLLIWAFGLIFRVRLVALFAAVFLSSLLFAWGHYIGSAGDSFELYSFLFRFFGGLWFTLLYAYRGFGVVALSHALYDIFILLGP